MFARTKVVLAALAVVGAGALAGCGSTSAETNSAHPGWPAKITIGAIPAENATALQASLEPIEELIKQKLGVDVEVFSGTSYSALIEAQKAGKVDLVEYGPLSFYIAQHTGADITNVGILAPEKDGDGSYNSIAWANSSQTDVHSLADFKGKKTCFVDPASTSGYLFPTYGLMKVGLSSKTDVTPVFAGGHDASLESIAKGTCEVGFSESIIEAQLLDEGKIQKGQYRKIWTSPTIPGSPFAVSNSLPEDLRTQLEKVLDTQANADQLTKLGICDDVDSCEKQLGFWGIKPPSVADYSVIDKVCAETKSTSCTNPDS